MRDEPIQRNLRLGREESEKGKLEFYYQNSWALVVGIDDYGGRHKELKNACSDAKGFADILKTRFKFEKVDLLLDEQGSHEQIMQYIEVIYPDKIEPNDRLIFFFAGHGDTRTAKYDTTLKKGYIIPQDAPYKGYTKYIDMDTLNRSCGLISAKHILIILDCCFSGIAALIADSTRGHPQDSRPKDYHYLREITEKKAWQILTAGDVDETVLDSSKFKGHSAFSGAILEGLDGRADSDNNKIITANELFNYVKPEVVEEASVCGLTQTPLLNHIKGSQLGGDFVFILPGYKIEEKTSEPESIIDDKYIDEMMQNEHYPTYISQRIFLVHSWKLAPFADEKNKNIYNVSVWVDAYDDSDLKDITRVTYRLYDDFSQKVYSSQNKNKNFKLLLSIWGEFTIVACVERAGNPPLLLTRYLDIPGSLNSVHIPSKEVEPSVHDYILY